MQKLCSKSMQAVGTVVVCMDVEDVWLPAHRRVRLQH
jgi:hypothetical protein